jgi:hypothetical protein
MINFVRWTSWTYWVISSFVAGRYAMPEALKKMLQHFRTNAPAYWSEASSRIQRTIPLVKRLGWSLNINLHSLCKMPTPHWLVVWWPHFYWCQQSGSINICAHTNCHLDACYYNDAYMNTHTTPHHPHSYPQWSTSVTDCSIIDVYTHTYTTGCFIDIYTHYTSSSITNTTDCFINTYVNDYTSTCTICTDPSSTCDACFTPSPMLLPIMIKDKHHTHHTAPSTTNATICMLHCHLQPHLHHNKFMIWHNHPQ